MKNNNKEKLVPKLRFNEFEGEWKETKLCDIAIFEKGKNISKKDVSKNGDLECIRYGELYTKYKEIINKVYSKTDLNKETLVLSKSGDVLLPSSGETAIDIASASCVNKDNVALGGDINIIRSNINGNFLAYYLSNKKRKEVARLAQGISVIHLYKSHLQSLKVNLPSPKEQQKISSFLSLIDKKIELLKKKKELLESYKKGVMQKIFNQEIRFKDKNGNNYPEWEEKRLGEICKIVKSGGTPRSTESQYYDGDIHFLSINDMTQQGKYLNSTQRYITEEGLDNSSSWLVPEDSIIYSMYASVGFVSINKIPVATSQAVLNLIPKREVVREYLYYYLDYFRRFVHRFIETGTQGNLNAQIVKNFRIPMPANMEQGKIAAKMSLIDEKLGKTEDLIYYTELSKRGLLQKMFI